MATTAELRIPVTVDGRTTVATFGQIEAAARKAAQAAADVGRGAVAGTDLVAQAQARLVAAQQELTAARQYDAQFRDAAFRAENGGIQASIAANAARARAVQAVTAAERELEQARQRATQGPSRDAGEFDQRTTRLAIQGIEDRKERQLAATRQTLQAEVEAINQIIARRQSLGELTEQQARQAREYARQLGENALAAQTSGAAREGGRSDRVAVNAQGAITSLAQGLQDASYARNIGEVARYAGNNLAQFATQAAYTATAAKATGQTLIGALAGAFTGPGGVVLAITAALSILPALITYLGRSAEAQRQAAEAAREHSAALNEQAVEIRSLTGARAAAAAQEKREQLAQLEEQLEANREAQQRLGPNGAAPILAEYDRRRANISRLPVFSFRPTEEVQLEQTAVRLRTEENRILENIDTVTGSIRVAEARATYDLGTRLALRRQEAQTLAETGANEERLAQVREEIRRDEDTLARRLQTGQYDPDTIERRAATAARTAEREAETARNRQARLGAQVAREQAALRAELAVAATREGVAREIAAAAKLRDERYAIARQDATLRLAVEAAYQRDVSRIREADERARTDRQIAALEQVAQARQQIDAAIGVGEDELAQQQIDNIRANALFAASTAADRLKGLDNIQASTADLVALIQRGTLADAEAFANRAGESEQVQQIGRAHV